MRELKAPKTPMKKPSLMQLTMAILVTIFAMSLSNEFLFGREQQIDWDSIEKAARIYFEYPSSENARIFRQQIQPEKGNYESGRYFRFIGHVFDNLDVLERQVASGDREAVKLGFMLYSFAIGAAKIDLDCVMGDLARAFPQLFLEELSLSPNAHLIEELGQPVLQSRLGLGGGRLMAYRYELEMRLKSLESVTSESLASIRDTCINKIKAYLAYRPDNPDIIVGKSEYLALFKKALILMHGEAEKNNLVCQRILEIEDRSGTGIFGVVSDGIIHSSGLFDEMTTACGTWQSMVNALRNPPLEYSKEYSVLRTMGAWAGLLYNVATKPSFRDDKKLGEGEIKHRFKENYVMTYEKFCEEFAKLAELMPDTVRDVRLRKADRQDILKKLR
jgi:hypothetical protein